MEKHFVTFYSPGTFVAEQSTQPIESWDVAEAYMRSQSVEERHGAKPYCFAFSTRARGDDDLDSHEIAHSPRFFIGGKIETLEDVEARRDPQEEMLRWNMRANGIKRIITTYTPWTCTTALYDDDVVLHIVDNKLELEFLPERWKR